MDEVNDETEWKLVDLPTLILVILGGLYVGSLGVLNVDILQMTLGGMGARLIQGLIGLSAVWQFFRQKLS
jgi:uncharacterized membrane protein YuzA (DUF378 family)